MSNITSNHSREDQIHYGQTLSTVVDWVTPSMFDECSSDTEKLQKCFEGDYPYILIDKDYELAGGTTIRIRSRKTVQFNGTINIQTPDTSKGLTHADAFMVIARVNFQGSGGIYAPKGYNKAVITFGYSSEYPPTSVNEEYYYSNFDISISTALDGNDDNKHITAGSIGIKLLAHNDGTSGHPYGMCFCNFGGRISRFEHGMELVTTKNAGATGAPWINCCKFTFYSNSNVNAIYYNDGSGEAYCDGHYFNITGEVVTMAQIPRTGAALLESDNYAMYFSHIRTSTFVNGLCDVGNENMQQGDLWIDGFLYPDTVHDNKFYGFQFHNSSGYSRADDDKPFSRIDALGPNYDMQELAYGQALPHPVRGVIDVLGDIDKQCNVQFTTFKDDTVLPNSRVSLPRENIFETESTQYGQSLLAQIIFSSEEGVTDTPSYTAWGCQVTIDFRYEPQSSALNTDYYRNLSNSTLLLEQRNIHSLPNIVAIQLLMSQSSIGSKEASVDAEWTTKQTILQGHGGILPVIDFGYFVKCAKFGTTPVTEAMDGYKVYGIKFIFEGSTYISNNTASIGLSGISLRTLDDMGKNGNAFVSKYGNLWKNLNTTATSALQGVQINGTDLPAASNKVNIPVAAVNTLGVIKPYSAYGTKVSDVGTLLLEQATEGNIDGRSNEYRPITPDTLNYAVKAALTDSSHISLDDSEKNAACATLGVDNYVTANAVCNITRNGSTLTKSATGVVDITQPQWTQVLQITVPDGGWYGGDDSEHQIIHYIYSDGESTTPTGTPFNTKNIWMDVKAASATADIAVGCYAIDSNNIEQTLYWGRPCGWGVMTYHTDLLVENNGGMYRPTAIGTPDSPSNNSGIAKLTSYYATYLPMSASDHTITRLQVWTRPTYTIPAGTVITIWTK